MVLALVLFLQKEKNYNKEIISIIDTPVIPDANEVMDESTENIDDIGCVSEKPSVETTEEVETEKVLTGRLRSTMRTHSADNVTESDKFTSAGDL